MMFTLGRSDVFSVGDLALRAGVCKVAFELFDPMTVSIVLCACLDSYCLLGLANVSLVYYATLHSPFHRFIARRRCLTRYTIRSSCSHL